MNLGCKPPVVAPHLHKLSFRMHAAMGASLPSSVDLRETGLVSAVRAQGGSSGCQGHAWSLALDSAFALAGDPLGFVPSEIDIYRGARSVERARKTPTSVDLPNLDDDGAMTEDVLLYLATFGIRARAVAQTSDWRNSDVEMDTVNDDVSLAEAEAASVTPIVGAYAIDPGAPDAEHQVQAALAARIPVRVDAFVDSAFENWTRGKPPVGVPDTTDTVGGGHAIVILGYLPGAYVIRSSWGTDCGDGGDFLASPAWLRAAWGLYPATVRRAA